MNTNIQNEKKRFPLSALDIAIILVLLALIITAAVRSGIGDKIVFNPSECTVTLSCGSQVYDLASAVNGSALYTEDGEELGTVKNIRTVTSGGVVTGYELDVSCSLMKKDARFVSESGTVVICGTEFTLHSKTSTFCAVVDSVS